ncbi:MAG: putative metal-binding motif-containing protein, partial [Deltaproteobacteria bacterium]|nr:putative metal-binding motif-containing protein [Deltaproteobacteria bacterium]
MLKWFATALALAGVAGSQPTLAADVVINNGQTPQSDPANVIDDATYASDQIFVRNVGCPPPAQPASASCPSPGIRTRVASRPGGETSGLLAYDTSHIELSDGIVHFGSLATHQTATANFTGGSVDGSVYGYDDSSLVVAGGVVGANLMSYFNARIELRAGSVNGDAWAFGNSDFHVFGGTIAGTIYATDTATVTIYGNRFELNGQPVGFGPLAVSAGTLTGVLTNGQSISNAFQRIGSGVIVLVEACVDPDLDGYGIFTSTTCLLGSNIDCDNNDPDVFPGNPEICDGKDNDCEWIGAAGIDNGLDTDADGDGVSIGPGCLLPGND